MQSAAHCENNSWKRVMVQRPLGLTNSCFCLLHVRICGFLTMNLVFHEMFNDTLSTLV